MTLNATRAQRRQLERDNLKLPLVLTEIPRAAWPPSLRDNLRVERIWRSREYLVQQHAELPPARCRLSICRTTLERDRWADGITWDQLQQLKREAGYGDAEAVEIYPKDRDVVNVANMRHLWILRDPFPLTWRNKP